MLSKIWTALKVLGLTLLVCICGLVIWNFLPNKSGPFPPDPAVIHANETFTGNGYREGYFEHQGHNIHYVESGEGPLVILVHGFPAYWYAMIRQMEVLKTSYRVVAIDTLGAGLSDAPKDISNYTLKTRTAHLNALTEHLAPNEKLHLIGHDWGGAFVFSFAQKYPEKTLSVTGISSPPHNVFLNLLETNETQQEISAYVAKLQGANAMLLTTLNAPEKIWEGAYHPMLEASQITPAENELFRNNFKNSKRINAYLNWYRANIPPISEITNDSYWPSKDARLDMPVLLIRGKDDNVFVPEYIQDTQSITQTSTILELENVGHWPHMEATSHVNKRIEEFLMLNSKRN